MIFINLHANFCVSIFIIAMLTLFKQMEKQTNIMALLNRLTKNMFMYSFCGTGTSILSVLYIFTKLVSPFLQIFNGGRV